jgi:hypothetical protein
MNINELATTYGKYLPTLLSSYGDMKNGNYYSCEGEIFPGQVTFIPDDNGRLSCNFFAIVNKPKDIFIEDVFEVKFSGEGEEELYNLLLKLPSEGWRVSIMGNLWFNRVVSGKHLDPFLDSEIIAVYEKDGNLLGIFNCYGWQDFELNP